MLRALLLLLLVPDVLPHHLLISPHGTDAVPSCPAMEPGDIAYPPSILPVKTDGRCPFQPAHRIGHTIFGGNTQTKMHMIRHRMAFDSLDAHVVTEFPEDLADIFPERAKDCLLAIFWYDNNVVSAIPPDMALVLPFSHWGFSCLWPWRVHNGRNHIPLHESTPERQSLFESHRQRRWLTHWSYR